MQNKSNFIFGLIVGFIVCYFAVKKEPTVPKITKDEQVAEEVVVEKPIRKPAMPTVNADPVEMHASLKAAKPAEIQATMTMHDRKETEQLETAIDDAVKQRKRIHFSERDVANMESQWESLHQQIQVSKEARGWRVKMIAPNTVFSNTGLNQGNLITYDAIRATGDEGNSNLPYRISTILNHVSVQ